MQRADFVSLRVGRQAHGSKDHKQNQQEDHGAENAENDGQSGVERIEVTLPRVVVGDKIDVFDFTELLGCGGKFLGGDIVCYRRDDDVGQRIVLGFFLGALILGFHAERLIDHGKRVFLRHDSYRGDDTVFGNGFSQILHGLLARAAVGKDGDFGLRRDVEDLCRQGPGKRRKEEGNGQCQASQRKRHQKEALEFYDGSNGLSRGPACACKHAHRKPPCSIMGRQTMLEGLSCRCEATITETLVSDTSPSRSIRC